MGCERKPLLRIEVNDPDAGLRGFLVTDTVTTPFCAGRLRMTPAVGMEEAEKPARAISPKMAMLNIPFEGAKSGTISGRITDATKKTLRAAGDTRAAARGGAPRTRR